MTENRGGAGHVVGAPGGGDACHVRAWLITLNGIIILLFSCSFVYLFVSLLVLSHYWFANQEYIHPALAVIVW